MIKSEKEMTDDEKISAIIPTYNRRDALRECIKSLLQQTKVPDEIIVVDDGSNDGTDQMIRNEFPFVKLITHARNKGAYAAFNTGIRNAKYEYIAMLDNDVTLPKKWIKNMLNEIKKENELAVVSGRHVPANQKNGEMMPSYYTCTINEGACIARKSALYKAGLYPEEFFIYAGGVDLAARLLNRGYKLRRCPSIISYHKDHRMPSKMKIYYYTRNKLWYIWKYFDFRYIVYLIPFHLFEYLVKAIKSKALREYFTGIVDAFKNINYAIENREVCKHFARIEREQCKVLKKTYKGVWV